MPTYRKPQPYRRARSYAGAEDVPAVAVPAAAGGGGLGWQWGAPGSGQLAASWQASDALQRPAVAAWARARASDALTTLPSMQMAAAGDLCRAPWAETGEHGGRVTTAPLHGLEAIDRPWEAPWTETSVHAGRVTGAPLHAMAAFGAVLSAPWKRALAAAAMRSALWRHIAARGGVIALPWSPARARSSWVDIDWPVQPNPGESPITIPELPVYFMLPTLTARRVSDGAELPLLSISIELDAGAWAWSFSAPMAYAGRALVDPVANAGPVEIEVTVNGFAWRFVVEGVDDNRRFGNNTLTLRGRSPSALLAAPYAPTRTLTQAADHTAAQLATEELANTGWTLLWNAPDWLLPAATFSYQDLAPVEAIAQLASAVGATVHTAAATTELVVAPEYPASPWAWDGAMPFAVLPASILTAGDSSWQGGANADGVYVFPEGGGAGALVRLAGSAGANALPMIVDRLLVHADAQRERGRNELAAAGMKRQATRTVPLFPAPPAAGASELGVVPIGALVEVEDPDEIWRGQVRAVRIDAQRSGAALSVRQHLTIERQYR